MDDVIENIEFLARSPNRVQILETLAEVGHAEKDELRTTVEADRTTVTRNLSALEDRGWIRTVNPTCTITPAGRDLVEDFQALVRTADVAARFQHFFRWIAADEFDLDIQALADAELFVPEPADPYTTVNQHVTTIENAEYVRALLPLTGLHAHEKAHEQVVANGAECEIVVTPAVAATHRSAPKYEELTSEMAATDRFHVYQFDGTIPYGLALLDETVQIFADDEGELRAMVETDAEQVYQWAERTFETYKTKASPISL